MAQGYLRIHSQEELRLPPFFLLFDADVSARMDDFSYFADSNRRTVSKDDGLTVAMDALHPVPAGIRDHGVSRTKRVTAPPDGAATFSGLLSAVHLEAPLREPRLAPARAPARQLGTRPLLPIPDVDVLRIVEFL